MKKLISILTVLMIVSFTACTNTSIKPTETTKIDSTKTDSTNHVSLPTKDTVVKK